MDSNIIAICLAAVCLLYNQAAGNESGANDADGNTICYGDLGCFRTNNSIFNLQELPSSPEQIDTKFRLFTRENEEDTKFQMLMVDDANSIANSNFDHSKPTKMVVHGFYSTGMVEWMMKMKNELLKAGDFNVILVDWEKGANGLFQYNQATVNTRVVGAVIAKFITMLTEQVGANPEDFHIIGHSLGAHISGYAGERIPNLGRITGLDPAGLYFRGKDKVVRLDPTDAKFVDVIHTDTKGVGMSDPVGHVDYYPNGGHSQPGCHLLELTCNHLRAYKYFTESINSACPFHGFRCRSYEAFEQGVCMPCYNEGCGFMGFYADRAKPSRNTTMVNYFLETGDSEPFCRYHYQITMSFLNVSGSETEKGKILVNLIGSNGELLEPDPTPRDMDIEPGRTYVIIVKSINYIDKVTNATMSWQQKSGTGNIYIKHLKIVTGIFPEIRILCSKDEYVGPGVTVYFA